MKNVVVGLGAFRAVDVKRISYAARCRSAATCAVAEDRTVSRLPTVGASGQLKVKAVDEAFNVIGLRSTGSWLKPRGVSRIRDITREDSVELWNVHDADVVLRRIVT